MGSPVSSRRRKTRGDTLTANGVTFDGSALFAAGHNNTTATVLSEAALTASRKAMRAQAAFGDPLDVLAVAPKFLLVSRELEAVALSLTTPNSTHRDLVVITIPHWTSTTAWYLSCDTASCPTFELGFSAVLSAIVDGDRRVL